MENLIFLFHFLRLTLLHYIYPNPRLSFHFFILFWLLCAFYYCKSLLPTIGRLDPRVPPDSVLLHSTVKLAPSRANEYPWTRKSTKRIHTAITLSRVGVFEVVRIAKKACLS